MDCLESINPWSDMEIVEAIDSDHFKPNSYVALDDTDVGVFDLLLGMVDDSEYDLLYDGAELNTDRQLQSAIILSVYTDAEVDGKKGWWGDSYNNDAPIADCKLWTLMGKPPTQENISKGQGYIKQAVEWLIDDGHLDSIDISVEHQDNNLDWFAFHLSCKKAGLNISQFTLGPR